MLNSFLESAMQTFQAMFGTTQAVSAAQPTNARNALSIDLVDDETPEEVERERKKQAQNKALTFQYLNTLKIKPNEKTAVKLQRDGKKGLKLVSEAYAKYKQDDKAKTLEQLLSLVSELGAESAKQLLNGGWLGSREVNYYFSILAKTYPHVYHIDSGENTGIDQFLDKLKKPNAKRSMEMRAANRIFWPICQDSHWYLIIMDKKKDQSYDVSCLDTLGWSTKEITDKATAVLKALYPKVKEKKLVNSATRIEVPKQHNFDDCGVGACYWGSTLIKGEPLPKNTSGKCDYSQYRFDIAEVFAKIVAKEKEQVLAKTIVIDDDEPVKGKSTDVMKQLRKGKSTNVIGQQNKGKPTDVIEQLRNGKFRI